MRRLIRLELRAPVILTMDREPWPLGQWRLTYKSLTCYQHYYQRLMLHNVLIIRFWFSFILMLVSNVVHADPISSYVEVLKATGKSAEEAQMGERLYSPRELSFS